MWQDSLLALTQAVFVAAMIPTIIHPTKKPTLSTSLLNTCTIFVVVILYMTLNLWLSALGAFVLLLEWSILAYQRFRLDKKEGVVR